MQMRQAWQSDQAQTFFLLYRTLIDQVGERWYEKYVVLDATDILDDYGNAIELLSDLKKILLILVSTNAHWALLVVESAKAYIFDGKSSERIYFRPSV